MKSQLAEVQTGFEPLLFHIQGIFAVSALFQRAAAAGFQKNRRKIFHKVMGAGLLVFTNQVQRLFALKKGATDWRLEMSEENRTSDPDRECCSQDSL